MQITQIRNATIIINYNDTKFLIDPWLGPKEYMEGFDSGVNPEIRQPRVELPFSIEKIVDVDAVIITHIHPDHWDDYAKNALDKNLKIFVQSDIDKDFMQNLGFNNVEILTFEGNEYKNIKLYKTSAQHGRREVVKPVCESVGMPYDSMGVIFKSENEKTLYLAGDTIWCPEVEDTIKKYTPQIIIVNACGARIINGERLIMDIPDLEEVIKAAPNSTIIASHMDTVSHLTVTRADLKNLKAKEELKNLLIPDDGETLIF